MGAKKGKKMQDKELLARKKEEFIRMLEALGPMNVKPYRVAEKLKVAARTLDTWKKAWITGQGVAQLDDLRNELKAQAQSSLKTLASLSTDENKELRRKATIDFLNGLEKFNKFLEAWGMKDVLADVVQEHHHKVEITSDKDSLIQQVLTKKQLESIAKKLEKI